MKLINVTPLLLTLAGSAAAQVASCADYILVVARGSGEPGGSTGMLIGGPLCTALKRIEGAKVSCEGVSTQDGYPAAMGDNGKPKGTCDQCITGAVNVFNKLAKKCPNAKFLFMGYSQGGALMSNAIPLLPDDVRARVVGGVLYGSTRGTIAKYPKENWMSICAGSDGVCSSRGTTPGSSGSHLSYSSNGDIERGAKFLAERISASGGGGKGAKGAKGAKRSKRSRRSKAI